MGQANPSSELDRRIYIISGGGVQPIDKHKIVSITITTAFFAFLCILSYSRALNRGISHDEYQFIASGELLARHALLPYVDYPFLHMPYIAFANAIPAFFSYKMLAVRIFNSISVNHRFDKKGIFGKVKSPKPTQTKEAQTNDTAIRAKS